MGLLIDGKWHDQWYDTAGSKGRFVRSNASFRNWVTADGSAGPSGAAGFRAEAGRYHLYVSYACPWAHRTLIMRALKGLEPMISLSVVHWHMGEHGWTFQPAEGVVADPILGAQHLHQVYAAADPTYTRPRHRSGPVGSDRRRPSSTTSPRTSSGCSPAPSTRVGARPGDYYPESLRGEIDAVNARVYDTLNNGVYKAGFATTQAAYEEAVVPLFETLDWLEARLARQRYVAGNTFTEADIRLFTTLVRFDAVYVGHFKCNLRRLVDYPNLWAYAREIFQMPEVAPTVHMDHIKRPLLHEPPRR